MSKSLHAASVIAALSVLLYGAAGCTRAPAPQSDSPSKPNSPPKSQPAPKADSPSKPESTQPTATKSSVPSPPSGYTLVWQDEFNTDGPVSDADWTHEVGFVRNSEDQWYQPANAVCQGGVLVIEARRERQPNTKYKPGSTDWRYSREVAEYTSGSILTKGKHEWTYGRFEMRGRIDIRQGNWPTFWTRGSARKWPGCGEIDIMEFFGGHMKANVQWGSKTPGKARLDAVSMPIEDVARQAGFASAEAWAKEFHVWRLDWDRDHIRLYLDDRLMNETDLTKTVNESPDGANPFHEPEHIILNLAIGGKAGGDPSPTQFPCRFEVDWVRVYQKPAK